MQLRPLSADPSTPSSVSGLDGTQYIYSGITFDTGTYHFTYDDGSGPVDITANLSRAAKQMFPGFDPVTDNYRLSAEARGTINQPGALQPLPTSTAAILAQNLEKEATLGTGSVTSSIRNYLLIGGAIYLLVHLLKK